MSQTIALVLYLGAFFLWLRSLFLGESSRGRELAPWVLLAGLISHFIGLVGYVNRFQELPLVGLAPSLSTLALVMGTGLVILVGLREGSRVGIVLTPVIVILQGFAVIIGIEPAASSLDFQGVWFAVHVALAFVAYGGLALAFAAGLLYLAQFHELKTKHMGRVFRFLPPLATLDRLGRAGGKLGFLTLSLSLAVSWAWTVRFRGSWQVEDPKVIWAIFTWFVFSAALLVRKGGGRKEWRGAVLQVAGFFAVVGLYLVLRLGLIEGTSFF